MHPALHTSRVGTYLLPSIFIFPGIKLTVQLVGTYAMINHKSV